MSSVAESIDEQLALGVADLAVQDEGEMKEVVEVVHHGFCAICLEGIALQETALVEGCEHAFCVTCILRWASYTGRPRCPYVIVLSSHSTSIALWTEEYMFEERVRRLLRASWFKPVHYDDKDDDDDDDMGGDYFSGDSTSIVRIGNRRWGKPRLFPQVFVDHRCSSDPPPVLFPCPRNYFAPRPYRAALNDMATDLCNRHLHLPPCCVSSLVPDLVEEIASVAADHRCYEVQNVELHVFPCSMPTDDDILRESFEAAEPKLTPASLASIEKLVVEKEGDEYSCDEDGDSRSCTICLDQIITRRSSLKMPCSHVFHETCIVEWLKVSHVCPLCRYEMPVDDDDYDSANNSDH